MTFIIPLKALSYTKQPPNEDGSAQGIWETIGQRIYASIRSKRTTSWTRRTAPPTSTSKFSGM
jgi:hypothetical protein